MFALRRLFRFSVIAAMGGCVAARAGAMIIAVQRGDPAPLLAFPFTALLPAILLALLAAMPAARTREGLLMRVGTMIQLVLIVALPGMALYLALGFPVVFLIVELFETRVPRRVREPLVRLVVA
ncbi:MAG TPA: hypothetical protein VF695_15515 [Sphingomonas sp.]|jgi:hypothetical protein